MPIGHAVPILVMRRYTDAALADSTGDTSWTDRVFGMKGTYTPSSGVISGKTTFSFLLSQVKAAADPAIKALQDMEKHQWNASYPAPPEGPIPANSSPGGVDQVLTWYGL